MHKSRKLQRAWVGGALWLCILLAPACAHSTGVLINEVLADPPPGSNGDANGDGLRHSYADEFVELLHTGGDTISLAQWKIGDDDSAVDAYFTFPAGTALAPGQLLVLFGGGSPALPAIATHTDDGRIGNGLSNGGDIVILLDAQGDTADIVRIATWPKDQSLARKTDGSFAPHSTMNSRPFSPGQLHDSPPSPTNTLDDSTATSDAQRPTVAEDIKENDPTAAAHSVDIFIRQILADPPNGIAGDSNGDGRRHTYEDEFVELLYTGTDTLSIGGWKIGDDDISTDAYFSFPASTKLPPNTHLVLFGGGQPGHSSFLFFSAGGRIGNGLSNGGDTVLLLNDQGQTVDIAAGKTWPSNQSIFRPRAEVNFAPHTALHNSPYTLPIDTNENGALTPPATTEKSGGAPSDSTDKTHGDTARAELPANLQLAISEILADPSGDANGDGQHNTYEDEFVELFNAGDPIDLSGWRLSDDDTPFEKQFAFPAGSILKSNQYLVLFGGGQRFTTQEGLAFVDDGRIGDGLANAGDRILLHHAHGDTLLSLSFSNADIDQSLHFGTDHPLPHGRLPASAPYSPAKDRPLYHHFSIETRPLHQGQIGQGELYGHRADGVDTLAAHAVQWLSTDTSTARIDERGRIEAKRVGTTRIEAWFDSLFLAQKNLSILAPEPPPNAPPQIISTPRQNTVYAGGIYRYQVEAKDPERATLVYALAQAPAGLRLHYASGLLSGRAPEKTGHYPIQLEVTDGRGGLAAQDFVLDVQKRPQLRISEVLADPPPGLRGDANGDGRRHAYEDEFVEIINIGNETVDLGSMRLGDTRKVAFSFPSPTRLAAGARTVVFGGGTPPATAHFFYANGRIGDGLGNRRDTVYLLSPDANDTLAYASYDLEHSPQQALVWRDSSAILHANRGVELPFSPGKERPVTTGISLADTYFSMIAGEIRRPTLMAHWSDGSQHRLSESVHWTSSASAIIYIDSNKALHALAPGRSTITAYFDTHSTPSYPINVHRQLEELLSFSPLDTTVRLRRGQRQNFTVHMANPQRLSYTWYTNGRRSPQRKPQRVHTCCQEHIDTLRIELKRGRERLRHQWLVVEETADKPVATDPPSATTSAIRPLHRAYPNPFNKRVYIEFNHQQPSTSSLDIYDTRGRRVRTLLSPALRTGYHRAVWDGRDDKGQQVASNVYFYRLYCDKAKSVGKILFLH